MEYYRFKFKPLFLLIFLGLFLFSDFVGARGLYSSSSVENQPPHIGGYALPASQQPGPLISFGQNLIGGNIVQLELSGAETYPTGDDSNNSNASMIYGFTDNTALFFNYALSVNRSTTPLNTTLLLEQSIYSSGTNKYQDQATIVGSLMLPLLQDGKNQQLPIENSALGYFLGATYAWMSVDWYWFVSPGITAYRYNPNHVQPGTEALYQAGLGRNIKSVSEKYTLFGLLELDGEYSAKNRAFGQSISNTGGNVITLTPSLYFATLHTITQLGVSVPVVQNLNGDQSKSNYTIVAAFFWTIP